MEEIILVGITLKLIQDISNFGSFSSIGSLEKQFNGELNGDFHVISRRYDKSKRRSYWIFC